MEKIKQYKQYWWVIAGVLLLLIGGIFISNQSQSNALNINGQDYMFEQGQLKIKSHFTELEAIVSEQEHLFSKYADKLPEEIEMESVIYKDHHLLHIENKFEIKDKPYDLRLIKDNDIYVNTGDLVDIFKKGKVHRQTLLKNNYLNLRKFRDLIDQGIVIDKEREEFYQGNLVTNFEKWLSEIPKQQKNLTKVSVNTQDVKDLIYILTKDSTYDPFIQQVKGDIYFENGKIIFDLDFEVDVYGLQVKGHFNSEITAEVKELKNNSHYRTINPKEFIAYYFGTPVSNLTFDEKDFQIIRNMIEEERHYMVQEEKDLLIEILNPDYFTKEQYEEIKKLLTENVEFKGDDLTPEEREKREKRFKELQEIITKKAEENKDRFKMSTTSRVKPIPVPRNLIEQQQKAEQELAEKQKREAEERKKEREEKEKQEREKAEQEKQKQEKAAREREKAEQEKQKQEKVQEKETKPTPEVKENQPETQPEPAPEEKETQPQETPEPDPEPTPSPETETDVVE